MMSTNPYCFILADACSCRLELAYFVGIISKNRLVCKNAVAFASYGSCRLLEMGSWLGRETPIHQWYLASLMNSMKIDRFPSIWVNLYFATFCFRPKRPCMPFHGSVKWFRTNVRLTINLLIHDIWKDWWIDYFSVPSASVSKRI